MPDKALFDGFDFAGNLLSSYLLILLFGVLAIIASPIAFIVTMFVPGDLASRLQGLTQSQ